MGIENIPIFNISPFLTIPIIIILIIALVVGDKMAEGGK